MLREKRVKRSRRKGRGTKHSAALSPCTHQNHPQCQAGLAQPLPSHVALHKSLILLSSQFLIRKMNDLIDETVGRMKMTAGKHPADRRPALTYV